MSGDLTPTLIWTVIVGMALTNFTFRFTPMVILSQIKLPDPVMRWLGFIPISVMGALFAKEILLPAFDVAQGIPLYVNPGIYGGVGAMLVFRLTKSFMISSIAGIAVYVAMRFLLGM
jgi:branched-subunit amino acid transport protein